MELRSTKTTLQFLKRSRENQITVCDSKKFKLRIERFEMVKKPAEFNH